MNTFTRKLQDLILEATTRIFDGMVRGAVRLVRWLRRQSDNRLTALALAGLIVWFAGEELSKHGSLLNVLPAAGLALVIAGGLWLARGAAAVARARAQKRAPRQKAGASAQMTTDPWQAAPRKQR